MGTGNGALFSFVKRITIEMENVTIDVREFTKNTAGPKMAKRAKEGEIK